MQTPSTPPFLQFDRVSWSSHARTILKEISFTVKQGAFTGLIGPNGAGKSSLLRCIYGVNRPQQGDIHFNQHSLLSLPARRRAQQIAVVLQETAGNFGLRLCDVVRMGLAPHKSWFSLDSSDDKQRIEQAIAQVGLSELSQQPFEQLSGGEKQRALIARAIVQSPQLLVMDEPTNHLDVKYQIEVLQLARSLGITVLASIHDLNLASAFCDQLVVLNHGQVVSEGSPAQVLKQTLLQQVFGIDAAIDRHPFHQNPRINYHYRHHTQEDC